MLRIVHPAREGQPIRPPKGRRSLSPSLSLTDEETRHFRASLKNLVRAYGSWACLAEVIGVGTKTLQQAIAKGRQPSGVLVIRVAQAAGMDVAAIIGPALNEAGRCKACGSRVADRRAS